jgi:hypothetical protein
MVPGIYIVFTGSTGAAKTDWVRQIGITLLTIELRFFNSLIRVSALLMQRVCERLLEYGI